ncbi:anti-sigma factor [Agrobacterium vaccinii]|uniref:anti-sigma factor n=1 Tax=Agrobacterium vaccinii TaxID=2735528 RepID=UPI001E47131F|nr:anti-sigma factor [Agrobacterium vaccinii]UHS58984.1 anti-sigma factor [Agrobacterium vaccinii]
MTESDDSNGDIHRDDTIVAEYVLGVLSLSDRQQVERRMRSDGAFAQQVHQWEARFSSLNDDYQPVSPNASTYTAIEARLFEQSGAATRGLIPSLWGSLAFWRGLSALTTACAIIVAVSFVTLPQQSRVSYMAELSSPDAPMALMVSYDAGSGRMALTPMAAGEASQKSLELWMVKPDGTPHSLGVFDPKSDAEIIIPVDMRDQMRDGVTLAVSLEPYGGSPTGKPTGPILASGTTRQL